MKTNILAYVLGSEQRQTVVRALLEHPRRQWSCSTMEDVSKLPHATVFRTLRSLRNFNLLKSSKINKRDLVYELVHESKFIPEIKKGINIEQHNARAIAKEFAQAIRSKNITAIILYGSAV